MRGGRPDKVDAFLAVCDKWEVPAVVLGEVTDSGRLVITYRGEVVVDVPPRTVAHDGPVYQRPISGPRPRMPCRTTVLLACSGPGVERARAIWSCEWPASDNLCSRGWITDQYDRYVRGNTVLAQPADAGMVRVADDSTLGLAMASDCNGRFTVLDPYPGAQLALAEAYRNVVTGRCRSRSPTA